MAEPDFTLLDKFAKDELGRRAVESQGGGGHDGGMDGRVARLEEDVKDIKADLKALVKDVVELKGRAAAMPTTWQLLSMILVVIGIVLASSSYTLTRVDRLETKVEAILSRLPPPNH